MTRLLLDTTFLVEAERDSVELAQAIEDDADVAVAAITMAELLVGVHLASSPHRRTRLTFVEQIAARYGSSSHPPANKKPAGWRVFYLAERVGFEPTKGC